MNPIMTVSAIVILMAVVLMSVTMPVSVWNWPWKSQKCVIADWPHPCSNSDKKIHTNAVVQPAVDNDLIL